MTGVPNQTETPNDTADHGPAHGPAHGAAHVVGHLVVGDHGVTVRTDRSVVVRRTPTDRPRPTRRAPGPLPRIPPHPIGRDPELAALLTAMDTERTVQLFGPPGTGRTTLLIHAAHVAGRRGGVIYLNARGRTTDDVLQDILESCYDTTFYRPTPTELTHLLTAVEGRVLIDDLDVPANDLDRLFTTLPNAAITVTSRHPAGDHATALGGLDLPAALALVGATLNRPLDTHEILTTEELWLATGGQPQPLLRAITPTRTLATPAELPHLIPQALTGLPPTAQEITALLALADAPISTHLMPHLVTDPTTLPTATGELVARRLIDLGPHGYELAPDITPDTITPHHHPELVATRLTTHARHTPATQLAAHTPLITRTIDATITHGHPHTAATLARTTAPILATSARLDAWATVLDHGLVAAHHANDHHTTAYLTHERGIHALLTGHHTAATTHLTTAATTWHTLGDHTRAHHATTTAATLPPTPTTRRRPGTATTLTAAAMITAALAVGGYVALDTMRAPHEHGVGSAAVPTLTTPHTATATLTTRATLPRNCPTHAFFGTLEDRDTPTGQPPDTMTCHYRKGSWPMRIGILPGIETSAAYPRAETTDIPGTDSAWVQAPAAAGDTGVLVATIDGRSLKVEYVGDTNDAITAVETVLGVR